MPMRSQAQRAYLHIHHPEIAAEFEAATPKGAKLPEHVGDAPRRRKKARDRKRRMDAMKRRAHAYRAA